MDAFFSSVEQRDAKSLRGKPIAVGFDSPRSVVSTASYEARTFGVHSAMPMSQAKQLCKELIIVPPRFDVYEQVSNQVRQIMRNYTDIIETISIDEAFLDVTENKVGEDYAIEIAKKLKCDILYNTFLTSSAGVSYNKFLAKIASDWKKPDGLFVIHPLRALDFIAKLPVEKIWGIGPKTLERMHSLGIFSGDDLRRTPLDTLVRNFGKAGHTFHDYANGIGDDQLVTKWERKSVSCEQTMQEDIISRTALIVGLYNVTLELVRRIDEVKFKGRCLTLKYKYHDFSIRSHSLTQTKILTTKKDILPLTKRLAKEIPDDGKPIRLIGLRVSNEQITNTKYFEPELPFDKEY